MSKQTNSKSYTGVFKIVGATYDSDGGVVWCCRYYEPFNVIDDSPLPKRKKLWSECESHFGKQIRCVWEKQTRRGTPLGRVTGHIEDELVQLSVQKAETKHRTN